MYGCIRALAAKINKPFCSVDDKSKLVFSVFMGEEWKQKQKQKSRKRKQIAEFIGAIKTNIKIKNRDDK